MWRPALILALAALRVEGSCFGRDASFTRGGKPTVTQPSSRDPTKVMVDWSKIVTNIQCVDKFVVWMWPDGTDRSSSTTIKKEVAKNIKSNIMEVQACVGYRFAVELDEREMTGNKKFSGETLSKTTGEAKMGRLDASQFTVGYHWDPVRQVSDLRLASISFPRTAVENANCLDYIQVTGEEVRARARPSLSRASSTSSMTGRVSWSHLGGSSPSSPAITAGGASTLPGLLGRGRSTSSSSSTSSGYVSPFGPVETPHYSGTLPRNAGGASHHAGPVKVQPPFLYPMIEILVAAKDCAEYNFEVKVMAPRSKELKRVSGVHLAALADLPYYVPPPITDVMTISFKAGKPVYGVKTASGVSAACLPAYFEALDAFRQRLENEVSHVGGRGGSSSPRPGQGGQGSSLGRGGSGGSFGRPGSALSGIFGGGSGSQAAEEQALRTAGCICTSTTLELATTDASLRRKTPAIFGHFAYKGTSGGRPYYQRVAPPPPPPGSPATPTTAPSAPTYLFWLPTEKQWMVGPTLASKSGGVYSTDKNSLAACPADPQTVGNWQRKGSFLGRWKKEASMSMTCVL